MAKSAYSEKFLDPRWQKKRLEIMGRDQFKCKSCDSSTETLNVHHRYYVAKRAPWDYPDWCLETLCKSCHKNRHENSELQPWEEIAGPFVMLDPDGYCAMPEVAELVARLTASEGTSGDMQDSLLDLVCRIWVASRADKIPVCGGSPWLPSWVQPEQMENP